VPEVNPVAVTILIALFAVWKLDFIATLLNLARWPQEVPGPLRDVCDEERLLTGRAYARAAAKSSLLQSALALTALLLVWWSGGFAWADQATRQLAGPGRQLGHGLLFLAGVFLASHLFHLPFRIHDTFALEARFGFNRTTPRTFALDELKGLALTAILGLPLAAAVLWLFLHLPNAWLWAWLLFTAVQLLLSWLAPSLILPLFNKFSPMPPGPARDAIEQLARDCAFPLGEVFVMDGSKRSTRANAFFTGFGRYKKIALFDTLVEKHSLPELVAVLAHEIGHCKLHHIPQRHAAAILQSAALFFLLGLATDPHGTFAQALARAFGLPAVAPHSSLVCFLILLAPAQRLLDILFHAWSRRHEFQADAFARQVTGTPEALANALKKLSSDNLSHPSPHPLRVALDYSHPPLLQRLEALTARDSRPAT
jgi:STE24 endopeptidase